MQAGRNLVPTQQYTTLHCTIDLMGDPSIELGQIPGSETMKIWDSQSDHNTNMAPNLTAINAIISLTKTERSQGLAMIFHLSTANETWSNHRNGQNIPRPGRRAIMRNTLALNNTHIAASQGKGLWTLIAQHIRSASAISVCHMAGWLTVGITVNLIPISKIFLNTMVFKSWVTLLKVSLRVQMNWNPFNQLLCWDYTLWKATKAWGVQTYWQNWYLVCSLIQPLSASYRPVGPKLQLWFITSGHFSIDGGSKPLSKTYPILVYGIDPTQENIVWKMLDIGTLHIEDQAMGENIFALLSDAVVSNALSLEHCLALNFDNANIMSGDKKGFFCRLCSTQPACHLTRCVCYLLSLTAQVGSAEMNYNINNLLQDIWHYLDKSNVRQGSLHKIQGENAKKMLRNAPLRWLDFGRHCLRLLSEWNSLNQFVKEEKTAASQKEGSKADNEEVEAQRRKQKTRFARIEECLNSRECKIVVLFLDYVMAELFDPVNKHFQSMEPLIATAKGSLEGFIHKLQSGFVQPAHTPSTLLSAVQHNPRSH